jgi:hypothetical protein
MTPDEVVDHTQILRLQAAYADAVTRRAWDELEELFVPDAPVSVDTNRGAPLELRGAAAVGGFIGTAIERFSFFELVPLNTVVELDGPSATGRWYIMELRQDTASGRFSQAFGVYRDTYARDGGPGAPWRFARRMYRSLARTGSDLEVIPPSSTW